MKKINEIVEEYLAKKIFSEVPESKPIFRAENFGVALQSDGKNILHFDCEYVPVSAVKRAENPDLSEGVLNSYLIRNCVQKMKPRPVICPRSRNID